MLGILGVVALVLGAFIAGGGAFDWEFLFSDGYREHPWVRSTGREGARGLMVLLGSLLAIGGFVSQVVDAASNPVAVTAALPGTEPATIDADSATSDERQTRDASIDSTAPRAVAGPSMPRPNVAGPNLGGTSKLAPTDSAPSSAVSGQAITIWHPDVVDEENQTLVILQYRFEPGHRPVPGSHYHWLVAFSGASHEITYDAEAMQKEGQVTHVFSDSAAGRGFDTHWSTWLEVETEGRRKQISNTLEITGGEVQSKPLAAAPLP
jgi:hypothetical protein